MAELQQAISTESSGPSAALADLMVGGITTLWGKRSLWSVDRWGRFLVGASVFALTLLAVFHHPGWLAAIAVVSLNLIVTSLTDRCALHDLLMKLGAKEREQLLNPDGTPRQHS